LAPTLDAVEALRLPSESVSVHLDGGYESNVTHRLLEERELVGVISEKGKSCGTTIYCSRLMETIGLAAVIWWREH
jgi:hypothetical protein